MIQRRAILLNTSLKVKRSNFDHVAASFASVSPAVIHLVSQRTANGDFTTANNADEKKVLELMKQVKTVTATVPGSTAARMVMRNEIRALMIEKGLPSFYLTINPADIYNPLVKFLAGTEIDIDNLLPEHVPLYRDQSILIAKNPAVAARFFNIYLKAFIQTILGYDPKQQFKQGGILGHVNAYYGCVEAQGRGTLHCHMLIWIEGSLNPNQIKERVLADGDSEFKDRLIAFLDDTISNAVPDDPDPSLTIPSSKYHPCSVRSTNDSNIEGHDIRRQKDLHYLVGQCQRHMHTDTCYKYWKGFPEPKVCRFDLDEDNTQSISCFDDETGELHLRCLDGLVNNFNETIIQAVRCNMDLKVIASGAAAKAMAYYVTDYITKSQLKTHVAFAALELAVRKLGEYDPNEDELTYRAKRLLQRCAYTMISHQELSAQQVVSYLMDFEDHFTSHKYRNLYWTSFERYIDKCDPSPECYPSQPSTIADPNPPEGDTDDSSEDISRSTSTNEQHPTEYQEENGLVTPKDDYDDDVDEDFDEEVTISVDPQSGNIIPRSSQVSDYMYRGNEISVNHMSLWDFVSRADKITNYRSSRKNEDNDDLEIEIDNPLSSDDESDADDINDATIAFSGNTGVESTNGRKFPRVALQPMHQDFRTHILSIRPEKRGYVPVPIGPALPRRNVVSVHARYCRLMLILFKPWRSHSDLRQPGQSWENAFNEYMPFFSQSATHKIDNMQIIHECKDSRDDHFAKRSKKHAKAKFAYSGSQSRTQDSFFGSVNEQDMLEHLEEIDNLASERSIRSQCNVVHAIEQAERAKMFNVLSDKVPRVGVQDLCDEIIEVHADGYLNGTPEDAWKKTYDTRREIWKRSIAASEPTPHSVSVAAAAIQIGDIISDGSDFRDATLKTTESSSVLVAIENNFPKDLAPPVNIDDIVCEYTLNTEQARAFRIIANHSLAEKPDPLRMFLSGPGGTGKSRVINALREYFTRSKQSRRFRLASYTGVAAQNIGGTTLHAALCLNQRAQGGAKGNKTRRDLIAMWEGVDYLFIDEVSMVGCNLLLQISEALIEAKGNTAPFGGISIIFAGDFSQLPPVGHTRLYTDIDTRSHRSSDKKGQRDIAGKLLWLSVNTVVILYEVMRQSGPENELFVSLLGRLREGRCTVADYEILNKRLLENNTIDWTEWSESPIIVTDNATKDALNERLALTFAKRSGRQLHWYYCTDVRGGAPITDPDLRNHLLNLNTGKTNQRLGRIPLVIGMPVTITQNYDVQSGIVNGTTGVLKKIRYVTDADGYRHAISCVVESPTIVGEKIPMLEIHEAAVLQEISEMTFTHPKSKKRLTVKRTQLPIVPAFAMTAHKSQGQTLPKALVDLSMCHGTESPYVMISRVKSLDGLLVLRPFDQKKIQCRQSAELRAENKRLKILELQTIIEHGTDDEAKCAQEHLTELTKLRPTDSRHTKRAAPQSADISCQSARMTKRRRFDNNTAAPSNNTPIASQVYKATHGKRSLSPGPESLPRQPRLTKRRKLNSITPNGPM